MEQIGSGMGSTRAYIVTRCGNLIWKVGIKV
jgi:hypothetical protein